MNRAQVRWHRLKCLVRCIGQFALAANQRSAGEVTLFEPQSWHRHKLERFQHAYNKEYVVVVLHDGQVIYHQGDPIDGASGVYVVLEGIVSSYKNAAYDYSDKAYPAWHQATYPSEDVQFGTCETTATTGDTFGNVHQSLFSRGLTIIVLRHRTFKAHEVLSRQGDPDIPLVIVVAGKVLLYVQDSVEESRCRLLGPQNASAPASSGTITKKSGTNAASALTGKVEYDPGLGWCVGELGDGECFGEQAVASGGVQSATLRMVRDIAKALRRCDAGLFFQQFGQYALETMAQEAAVRVVDAGTIVLQQDHTCEYMYIVLNGSINIHRLTARRKQRRQSSIIHMELHQHKLPDDSHPPTPHGTTRDGADTSASLGTEIFDKCGQFLSSLGVGGAFGHVPILTNSHSQSSYVVARNLAKGTLTAMLLCVPARFVAALLQRYDDSLLYNPRQVLDQATKPKHDRQNALKFANFLCTKTAFAAMPQRTLHCVLESMQVVDIPFNHLLWDQGERLGHGVVVVLAGSVLLVRSGRTHPRLVLHVGRTANTVTLMHSHDQVHSCGPGDCIGSMRIDDSENNTIVTTDTAMTLTDCKVAIIQWPRVYVVEPYVAKLCNDLLALHATHLKRQQEQLQQVPLEGESPPLTAPATSDDVHAAIGNLLSAIEWKDRFPVRVQGCIAELFTFAVYSSNDISTKSTSIKRSLSTRRGAESGASVAINHPLGDIEARLGPGDVLSEQALRARDHWKLVIHYIIKNRSQRSHWPCVIEFARQKRIRLVMDIVKNVPVFQAMDVELRVRICERTLFQTLAPNVGKPVERFFVVVRGTVDLVHVTSPTTTDAATSSSDASDSWLKIRTVRAGEWFGEYEILAHEPNRQILAMTTAEGAHVVAVYKGEFIVSWPTLQKWTDRLAFLRQVLVVPERSSANKMADAIYWIDEGECVVHQATTLVRAIKESRSHEKDVELDVQVATLTRGNVLYCDDSTWMPRTCVIASSYVMQAFVLTYPSHPTTTATQLAVASEPKPIDSPLLPLLKCVPIARMQGNRVKLPNFLLQRHVPPPRTTADASNQRPERDPQRASLSPTARTSVITPTGGWNPHRPLSDAKPSYMNGSFAFNQPSPTQPRSSPLGFLETAHVLRPQIRLDETETSSVRLQKALDLQIHQDVKLLHELGSATIRSKLSEARREQQVRIKHGRPTQCPRTNN
ncbi:hypothetical protein DYB37_003819 [Aphanomyces astaci]|uniref:Cyclic nucleotide-binding domain-containing protein n=1 Tax=Aphanomyces astaci TaxID=112090 RepID=A0A418EWS5_APHAT|nr:hypothetical protein DYB37_003819 [Aphanomyces astaci]